MIAKGVAADTHAIVWYIDSPSSLSPKAAGAMDNAADDATQRIFISAISLIEIHYLTEKGRINTSILPKILAEIDDPQPIIEVIPIDRQVSDHLALIPRNAVPDMPDRIIAATSLMLSLPLVTVDTKIHAVAALTTIW
ncbi:MAG: type II toxin-antitoxin system VapC family toxin [Blastocatellia bacterium]|nr:type II toxin-antitoxin system VapC family toxin [Blastocatellia bacterium]